MPAMPKGGSGAAVRPDSSAAALESTIPDLITPYGKQVPARLLLRCYLGCVNAPLCTHACLSSVCPRLCVLPSQPSTCSLLPLMYQRRVRGCSCCHSRLALLGLRAQGQLPSRQKLSRRRRPEPNLHPLLPCCSPRAGWVCSRQLASSPSSRQRSADRSLPERL